MFTKTRTRSVASSAIVSVVAALRSSVLGRAVAWASAFNSKSRAAV